ncbi:nucleoside triphosphate pyrophosphohydrolase [Pseudoalteromonas sp. T1lg88]|uniref:nucleoside triphosphate pyrophosphohydrolase n=1 Tax=Pseudoalteromonas sp. T1lg88 TaxID=2077104 RepID=UPI000CF68CF8|nr:nucleoside triphosphate pyrophosphohydrolase [Pseudoalteromonas sp. T1lg88]
MSHNTIAELQAIMAKLRCPESGCDWDLAQTFKTIVPHTLEEAYEVADTIERGAYDELKAELGDLLFQVIFYSQLASEQQLFDFNAVVAELNSKLKQRHPHIFADGQARDNWETRKHQERQAKGQAHLLDDIPTNLPALSAANKIQKRVAAVGFDWPSVDGALDKVAEEVLEVREAIEHDPNSEHCAEELGDLLFATVNVARHLGRDPEQLLRQANRKFSRRFNGVEEQLAAQGLNLENADLEQMEAAWQAVKEHE